MKFHILTLFPEMVQNGLNTSIIGRAVQKGLLSIDAVNIRDFTQDKHGKVDDYPYGGGAGMLMQAQPVYDAWSAVTGNANAGSVKEESSCTQEKRLQGEAHNLKRIRTLYMTPQGQPFNQKLARELETTLPWLRQSPRPVLTRMNRSSSALQPCRSSSARPALKKSLPVLSKSRKANPLWCRRVTSVRP